MKSEVELCEAVLRTLIREVGLDTTVTALHNACAHGDEFSCTEDELRRLFKRLDKLIAVTREIGD